MYDYHILKSTSFDNIACIVVGNLSAGGSGKTPFCEYLISRLSKNFSTAYLSRGYARKSRGFLWVEAHETAEKCGDEALQIKQKYPNTPVAVCESRVDGLRAILKKHPDIQCIILDDAFQHRSLKADYYFLLSDFQKPFFRDWVLPMGKLRESRMGALRADEIVITKCPASLANESKKSLELGANRYSKAPVSFTRIKYLTPVENNRSTAIALSALANPQSFENFIEKHYKTIIPIRFADHHTFSQGDIYQIIKKADEHDADIYCTDKDYVKIKTLVPENLLCRIQCIKIEIDFIEKSEALENRMLKKIVSKIKQQ